MERDEMMTEAAVELEKEYAAVLKAVRHFKALRNLVNVLHDQNGGDLTAEQKRIVDVDFEVRYRSHRKSCSCGECLQLRDSLTKGLNLADSPRWKAGKSDEKSNRG